MKKSINPAITNFPSPIKGNQLTEAEKIAAIEEKFTDILEILGLDTKDESLEKTPYRVAKMYVNEIFSGLDNNTFPEISFENNTFQHDGHSSIIFASMAFTSFCIHHLVPMDGMAYIAYVPNQKIIGLSKIPRVVKFFSRRPQVQERLSAQIADSLSILLETPDVAVSLTAKHYCVIARGIESEQGITTTNFLTGKFDTDAQLREEFFEAIHRHNN